MERTNRKEDDFPSLVVKRVRPDRARATAAQPQIAHRLCSLSHFDSNLPCYPILQTLVCYGDELSGYNSRAYVDNGPQQSGNAGAGLANGAAQRPRDQTTYGPNGAPASNYAPTTMLSGRAAISRELQYAVELCGNVSSRYEAVEKAEPRTSSPEPPLLHADESAFSALTA
jgi:hypothetical protein